MCTRACAFTVVMRTLLLGGRKHCGGDLLFTDMILLHPLFAYRMPLFMMAPGAVAMFAGADAHHGTCAHHARDKRAAGCKAHISFAVQTPAASVRLSGAARREVHQVLLHAGAADVRARNGYWADAVWLPVFHNPQQQPPGSNRVVRASMVIMPLWHFHRRRSHHAY